MQLPTRPEETFTVWAKPQANQTQLVGYHAGRDAFEIRLAATPTNGKANQELLNYLQETHGLTCKILSGHGARKKRIKIIR